MEGCSKISSLGKQHTLVLRATVIQQFLISEKKEKVAVWKAFCMRPKPLRCFPGCLFEVLAPELHTEGASGDGPFSDVDDYDETSSEDENEENINGDSDKETGAEEGFDKDEASSDEEEKD